MRAAHRNHAVCGCGRTLSFSDNEHAYLAAMEVGKLLVRDGSATVDALARWASELAEAALGARADADVTAAHGQMCVDQALRIADLAAAGSFGRDTTLARELAMMKAVLGGQAEQVVDRRPGAWSRLTSTARSFWATRW